MENTRPADAPPLPETGDREPTTALELVAAELRERAFLHSDPAAYRAGVRDALEAFTRLTEDGPVVQEAG